MSKNTSQRALAIRHMHLNPSILDKIATKSNNADFSL